MRKAPHTLIKQVPTKARSGARYITIMVTIDSNTVLAATPENKSEKEHRIAYLALLKRLKRTGIEIKKYFKSQLPT